MQIENLETLYVCQLLTVYFRSPRPVNVEMMEQKDEEDGLTEKFVQRNEGFRMDREKEPRFAQPGSFEFEFGMKHRRIDQMEKEGIERVKSEMEIERKRLAEEMETAMFDYQAEQIRQGRCRCVVGKIEICYCHGKSSLFFLE